MELGAAMHRGGRPEIARLVDRLLDTYRIEIEAFDAGAAAQAYRDFGRGSEHPAQLNVGDTYDLTRDA
ncbi:hypothetical protein [Mycobacterium vicinigordonae]|uniref:hypothetical protein n=1 Tax=Mycobacterium vicinigordonae TaxID=1719132 RepID=UPI001FE6C75E|nr:hypothetical protein [Mycobacterium vicinigordonae]